MIAIIPAIDIIDGKCVRLVQGDYKQVTVYSDEPLDVAKSFESHGIQRIHLVDLDGAKSKHVVNWKTLETIKAKTSLFVDFGGGMKSDEDLKVVFDSGADQITAGSIAVTDQTVFDSWLETYGPDKIILGADTKNGKIAINGWQEDSELSFWPFLERNIQKGIEYCICTDVARDGMLEGSSEELYKEILHSFPALKLIASGGIRSLDEINKLSELGCFGAIVGKAIYEGYITLKEIENFIVNAE